MTVCHFGIFDPQYSRNRIIARGLSQNGATVMTIMEPAFSARSVLSLIRRLRAARGSYDVIIVACSDSRVGVFLARMFGSAPVVWDAFYSLYDTRVNDRALARRFSLKAAWYWLLDRANIALAHVAVFDTEAHREYFIRRFGAAPARSFRIFLGADDSLFYPQGQEDPSGVVGFYGKYIPLQGIETIIRAAAMLKDKGVPFELIGRGQTYKACRALADELRATNIHFVDRVPYEELPRRIGAWTVSLGVFGDSEKMRRVIPNKVYDAAAMGKAVITADSPAIRELFTDGENILLCRPDPQDLAAAIMRMRDDARMRSQIGAGALALFKERVLPKHTGQELLAVLATVVRKNAVR